jgi:uncharacterized protein YaaR (DUF327 family)
MSNKQHLEFYRKHRDEYLDKLIKIILNAPQEESLRREYHYKCITKIQQITTRLQQLNNQISYVKQRMA